MLSVGAGILTSVVALLGRLFGYGTITPVLGPLLVAATALVLGGVVILCLGLVAEILCRTYYESQKKPIYALRTAQNERWIDEPIPADGLANERVRAIR